MNSLLILNSTSERVRTHVSVSFCQYLNATPVCQIAQYKTKTSNNTLSSVNAITCQPRLPDLPFTLIISKSCLLYTSDAADE